METTSNEIAGNMNYENIYFLGIGGIGMSALARYFKAKGKNVSGYDRTPTHLTDELRNEDISIHFEDNVLAIDPLVLKSKEKSLVVYTPAIPKDHSEFNYLLNNGFTLMKRSEVLGYITEKETTLAVAGTHGKTTTSTMLAHILKSSEYDCSAFLGGISTNYNTNLLLGSNSVVVEADEYDRSFLTLHPDLAIITSVDADHLDIYGSHEYLKESFELFVKKLKNESVLISKLGLDYNIKENENTAVYFYSLNDKQADFYADNLRIINGKYHFDFKSCIKDILDVELGLPGLHNVENAVAAIAAAQALEVEGDRIRKACASFSGVKRRFEYQIKRDDLVYIDDYAHHPAELAAAIGATRLLYPNKKITGVFQPHLFSRTRDFADEFAKSLDMLDECILLDIYPARELPIEGITSEMLLNKMTLDNKKVMSKYNFINQFSRQGIEVFMTLGAGDIDTLVEPIKLKLLSE
jgi:UDP-N-acetylmuramate--alanine ligase